MLKVYFLFFHLDECTRKPIVSTLVEFVTGSSYLKNDSRPWLLLSGDSTLPLFQADSCFNKIIIPVAHGSYA